MAEKYFTPWNVDEHVGKTFTSDGLTITQQMINALGNVTRDPDPHDVDPAFSKEHSPWGQPISFSLLTFSLMTPLIDQVYRYPLDADPEKDGYPARYGFDIVDDGYSTWVEGSQTGHALNKMRTHAE